MLRRVPVIALLLGFMALAMLIPMAHAAISADWRVSRGFLYAALFGLFLAGSVALLLRPMQANDTARHELLTLLVLWISLPVYACLPLVLLSPAIGVTGAWMEMVAALTTTGGTVYPDVEAVPPSIHLWRGIVGWLGGLLTLMAAYVILAPRRLGGYEIMAAEDGLGDMRSVDLRETGAVFESRTYRALRTILPIYLGLTLALGMAFNVLDKPGLIAAVHAMSILSTSGISPLKDGIASTGNWGAEVAALIFMVLAATRLVYSPAAQGGAGARNLRSAAYDPELRLMFGVVLLATAALYLRHWVGVLTIDEEIGAADGFVALWGAGFTAVSFVTTTGFQSFAWESARDWSGLANPGLVLLCLCAIGGGAATTAGGIKLIRAHALLRHGVREVERIASPNSVTGARHGSRRLRRDGAIIAWAFMMLFFFVLLATILGLTLTGLSFDQALIAAVAALSNTGPAFAMVAERPEGFAGLDMAQHTILSAAMILGRIETLAVIALFNPDGWSLGAVHKKNTGKSGAKPSI
ncbi:MAG: potassium transporter TrkG [Pseudomonadota bacterium]